MIEVQAAGSRPLQRAIKASRVSGRVATVKAGLHHQQEPLHWLTVQRTVPAPFAIVPAVPSPALVDGERERREAQGDDAWGRGRSRRNQDEELQQSFRDHRPGNSFRKERQAFMKKTMDVARTEEKWRARGRH